MIVTAAHCKQVYGRTASSGIVLGNGNGTCEVGELLLEGYAQQAILGAQLRQVSSTTALAITVLYNYVHSNVLP